VNYTNINKSQLKIEQHELIENWGEVMGTRGVTLVAKPVISHE
jgi:hypothetical protein